MLKDIPENSDIDPEETVRNIVVNYFHDLGFTTDEIKLEVQFKVKLGTYDVLVEGRKREHLWRARSDILVTHNGRNLAVVETKRSDHTLKEEDAEQALSYARLLKQMAPFAIVTNGSDVKVYDVFSEELKELETALDSAWEKNGRQSSPVGEYLRFEAARKLFRFNPEAIVAFCKSQMERGLSEVKGSIAQGRSYVPELFVQRAGVDDAFHEWLDSDLPVFAIVGDSGSGKTNAMCHLAEHASSEHLVLFYQAMTLQNDMLSSIHKDLVWEFEAEKEIVFFINRLSEFANKRNCNVIIVVDGLDEFIGDQRLLKNELSDLAQRLRGSPVKLCVSCKSFDWNQYVIDKRRTYNQFAKNIFPAREIVHQPASYSPPEAEHVGVSLSNFSPEEKHAAFEKYKEAFNLEANLAGEVDKECVFPLMMRLVAEACQNGNLRLLSSFSNIEIFERYVENRLGVFESSRRTIGKEILTEIAILSIESGERFIDLATLKAAMLWTDDVRETFYDLIRINLIRAVEHDSREKATFSFERIRAFVYTTVAKRWQPEFADRTVEGIQSICNNELGLETIEFYFTHIDRGQSSLLIDMALSNFDLFVHLTANLKFRSTIIDMAPDYRAAAYRKRLKQFSTANSRMVQKYFPRLRSWIRPYHSGVLGVWVARSIEMFPARNNVDDTAYPIIRIGEGLAFRPTLDNDSSVDFLDDFSGYRREYINERDIVETLPQKLAWDIILADLESVIRDKRFYDGDNAIAPEDLSREESDYLWDLLLESQYASAKYAEAKAIISNIVDSVFLECKRLLTTYFPYFADSFVLHTIDASTNILIEVGVSQRDLITVVYAILPSVTDLPSHRHVVISHSEWKLYSVPLLVQNLTSSLLRTEVGKTTLDLSIDGIQINESDAIVFKVYLSHTMPVTDQVCQLIGLEANKVFRSDWLPDLWNLR